MTHELGGRGVRSVRLGAGHAQRKLALGIHHRLRIRGREIDIVTVMCACSVLGSHSCAVVFHVAPAL